MAYGTGEVPFVRTADLAEWELRGEPKQRVSDDVYRAFSGKTDVTSDDILVVRDGTYLVGTAAIVHSDDDRMLFAGGLYKLRVTDREQLDPYLLLALLHVPIVRQQIRAKKFTRDIIDTLGHRLRELVLPFPKDPDLSTQIAQLARSVLEERHALLQRAREIVAELEGDTDSLDGEIAAAVG